MGSHNQIGYILNKKRGKGLKPQDCSGKLGNTKLNKYQALQLLFNTNMYCLVLHYTIPGSLYIG